MTVRGTVRTEMQENPPTIGSADESTGARRPEILRRHAGLVGRTALVSALTLASRLLGFVREVARQCDLVDLPLFCEPLVRRRGGLP